MEQREEVPVICLGPVGSGKTLLLRKLQDEKAVDSTTTSVPTIGTNILNVKWTHPETKIVRATKVRELGGAMAPLWQKYFDKVKKVLYVVDTSNLCQISAAGVLLYTILSNPQLQKAKFLLVLTKMDVSYRQMRNEALLMMQMTRLQKEIRQSLEILEASAIDGEGRDEILKFLFSK